MSLNSRIALFFVRKYHSASVLLPLLKPRQAAPQGVNQKRRTFILLSVEQNGFIQPSLSGVEAVKPEETELDNRLVLSRPVYKDTGKKQK